jgi:chromate transporter
MNNVEPRQRPASLSELFISLTFIALQGFGGVLAIVQREVVEKHKWLTAEEFIEDWSVAQIMPGPNVVNLSLMLGDRWFGLRGALVAVTAMLTLPLLVVLLLALLYAQYGADPHVASALRGMGAVAAGLITATGLKLMRALREHPLGPLLLTAFGIATFVGIAVLRLPLLWVLLVLGGASCFITWQRLEVRE